MGSDDHRLQGWGRIEIPTYTDSTADRRFLVAMHWGDSDTFTTPTAVTSIDDADQIGLQAHGNGIESVILFSDAHPDIGNGPIDAIPTSTWPLGGASTTYDYSCYAGTQIRHVLANYRPGSTYNVSVSGSGTCTVTIAPTGGARTVGADGVLTFTTTNTTVGG